MPYTPPSVSPLGLHSVSPVKSSSSYAGLANGHHPQQHTNNGNVQNDTTSRTNHPAFHPNNHTKAQVHHRRSNSGLASPPRPIPVTAFAQERQSPRRPTVVRKTSSSTDSSDEDDTISSPSQRDRLLNLKELRDAIRDQLPPQHKAGSPPGSPDRKFMKNSIISPKDNLNPGIIRYDPTSSDGEQSSSNTPPDETIEFPRMVRKKSGEVVKPSLKGAALRRRPLSLPSTPVFPKAVHFDAQLEHVRHFLHSEKPLAVSTNTSPTGEYAGTDFPFEKEMSDRNMEKLYQLELPNWPTGDLLNRRRQLPVWVDSVYLSSNARNLVGKVIVKNLAYNKWVAVRFTFDHWQTVSEVSATYDSTQNGPGEKDPNWDRFTFGIKLQDFTDLENRHMLFCVRYNVGDQEFWDNNYGSNYAVEFRKRPTFLLRRATHPAEANGLPGVGDDSAIGDDFDIELSPETFAKNLAEQISSPRSALLANLGESPPFMKKATLTSSPSTSSDISTGTPQKRPTGKAFANRYDFSASLSAAIANANATMGVERSGLAQRTSSPKVPGSRDSYFAPLPLLFRQSPPTQSPSEFKEESPTPAIKKSHLTNLLHNHHFRSRSYPLGSPSSPSWSVDDAKEAYNSDDGMEKPPMDSTSYLDFINSYCFFEPGKSDLHHNSVSPILDRGHHDKGLLTPPQFPTIRATARSPPPTPRQTSPERSNADPQSSTYGPFAEYNGVASSDSNQSSPESSSALTPRASSPPLIRSSERSRDHSRDSSPSMRFHSSPLGFDTHGTPSTAMVS